MLYKRAKPEAMLGKESARNGLKKIKTLSAKSQRYNDALFFVPSLVFVSRNIYLLSVLWQNFPTGLLALDFL